MKNLNELDYFRIKTGDIVKYYGGIGDHECGAFIVPSPVDQADLKIIASVGEGWDHISVSRANRCPNWPEMEFVKRLFFKNDEAAMQLHVPPGDHINVHSHCLHIWRPHDVEIPLPPPEFVG